jgi:hypothetical protein
VSPAANIGRGAYPADHLIAPISLLNQSLASRTFLPGRLTLERGIAPLLWTLLRNLLTISNPVLAFDVRTFPRPDLALLLIHELCRLSFLLLMKFVLDARIVLCAALATVPFGFMLETLFIIASGTPHESRYATDMFLSRSTSRS